MDGHGDHNSLKETPKNTEMLIALLSHSEELLKGNRKPTCNQFVRFCIVLLAYVVAYCSVFGPLLLAVVAVC